MEKQTISFRLESDKVSALDALADSMDRDRSYLLSEAVQAYLQIQQWHLEQIEAGIAEADAGQIVDHSKVKAMASKWRRQKSRLSGPGDPNRICAPLMATGTAKAPLPPPTPCCSRFSPQSNYCIATP